MKKPDIDTLKVKKFLANFIIPLASLILVLVLSLFYILPSHKKVPVLEQEVTSASNLKNQLEEKNSKLATLIDFKSVIDENNMLTSEVLAAEPLVPQLLTQIDIIAKESGLSVDKLSYSTGATFDAGQPQNPEEIPNAQYDVVVVSLGVSGTYDQLVSFLKTTENAGRFIDVGNVRFSYNAENANLVSAQIMLGSPYVSVKTEAVTDDPIEFDISSSDFQDLISKLKDLRIYTISIDEVIDISNIPQATPEEIQPAPEELTPEQAQQILPL